MANHSSEDVSLLLGNGDGTFQRATNYPSGSASLYLALGDFDHNGKLDVAVAGVYTTLTGAFDCTAILLGDGRGALQEPARYSAGKAPYSVAVGDYNKDGRPDLAVTNSSGVSILLGKGDGTFSPAGDYALSGQPEVVVVGDFNQDGIPDLAVTESVSGSVAILLGKGDGTFRPAVTYPATPGAWGLVTVDLNGDG